MSKVLPCSWVLRGDRRRLDSGPCGKVATYLMHDDIKDRAVCREHAIEGRRCGWKEVAEFRPGGGTWHPDGTFEAGPETCTCALCNVPSYEGDMDAYVVARSRANIIKAQHEAFATAEHLSQEWWDLRDWIIELRSRANG